jgi:hypothetical protein
VGCPCCGEPAAREHVYRVGVRGPTVNLTSVTNDAWDVMRTQDYEIGKFESANGTTVQRPDDWAAPKRIAREMVRRGEVPEAVINHIRESEHVSLGRLPQ